MDPEAGEIKLGVKQFAAAAGSGSRNPETAIAIEGDEIADSTARPGASDAGGERRSYLALEISPGVCRICHLSAKEIGKASTELIELGCGCKGELGLTHPQCAEAWFRVKGNRLCEICGEIAKNTTGVSDTGFMQQWNESRSSDALNGSPEGMNRRCLRGQPLCNFLMACLVIAFMLPWFFRVNML